MASAFEIFSRAESLERAAADLYALVVQTFPWPAEDAALFKDLAQEELQHAARVRLLAAQYRNDSRAFSLDRAALASVERAERAMDEMWAEIGGGRWADDLPGLKLHLAELEHGCHAHADLLAEGSDPRVARFFRELAQQDRAHQQMLVAGALRPVVHG